MSERLKFWREDYGQSIDDAYEFDIENPYKGWCGKEIDLNYAGRQFAEYFFDNLDGWECSWPITFNVALGEKLLGKVRVDVEPEPVFYASEILAQPTKEEQ